MALSTIAPATLNAVHARFDRMQQHPDYYDSATALDVLVGPWKAEGYTLPAGGPVATRPSSHVVMRHRNGTFLLMEAASLDRVHARSIDRAELVAAWSNAITGTWSDIVGHLVATITSHNPEHVTKANTLGILLNLHDVAVCAAPQELVDAAYALIAGINRAIKSQWTSVRAFVSAGHDLDIGSATERRITAATKAHMQAWVQQQPDEDFHPQQLEWTEIAWDCELEEYLAATWPRHFGS